MKRAPFILAASEDTVSELRSGREVAAQNFHLPAENTPIRWFPKAIAILGAVLLAAGAGIALFHPEMLVSPHDEINAAARIYAGYLASRNLSIAIALLVALALGARRALNSFVLLVAIIQSLDALIDCFEHRWPIVPGVAVLALLFFFASSSLSGFPFWRPQAWKDAS